MVRSVHFFCQKFGRAKNSLYLCSVKRKEHTIARIAAMAPWLLLLLFATYYVQVNFFVHSHIVNGVTVVHSHMHRSTHHDTDTGGHSETELTIIASLNSQFLLTGEMPDTDVSADYQLLNTIGIPQNCVFVSQHTFCLVPRAPPAC